jgi:hypothetical protein
LRQFLLLLEHLLELLDLLKVEFHVDRLLLIDVQVLNYLNTNRFLNLFGLVRRVSNVIIIL